MTTTPAPTPNSQPPHAVCIPYPVQGNINPMLKVAKILYSRGFQITFVNTEYNHRRLLKSRGGAAFLDSLPPGFNFEAIPDGLPPPGDVVLNVTQDILSLCDSTSKHCLAPFRDLVLRLNDAASSSSSSPSVSCILSDGSMSFTLDVANKLGIPDVFFLPPSACGILTNANFHLLAEKRLGPSQSYLTNGYLEKTIIDFIPGLNKNIRMKHLPSFVRTTNPNDIMFNYIQKEVSRAPEGTALVLNTFDALDEQVIAALSPISPNLLTVGPLNLLLDEVTCHDDKLKEVNTNLWTVIRPDLVAGDSAILPSEFVEETKDRGLLAGWCCQEEVLSHGAVGGFLSHMGWNSTLESLSYGVPMLCWPFFSEQLTTCFYACNDWGIGMELNPEVKMEEVEKLVRELMGGEKGKEMKRRAMEWKSKAEEAIRPGGSSYRNMEKVIELLLGGKLI